MSIQPASAVPARRRNVRPWLRALHRDIGYLAVGFTVIYAVSGLAVNHIGEWDPSFRQVNRTHELTRPLLGANEVVARQVLEALHIAEQPRELYRPREGALDIVFDKRTLHVDTVTGVVQEEGQEARFFLRAANFLHLNRGKKAWTYLADAYAVFLLFLAISGLFMIPGRKGLLGRGAIIASLGAAIPIAYMVVFGSP